ncbi:MAG: LytR/AlgR family response regulator transcription factor [Flavobacteriales bacterium]
MDTIKAIIIDDEKRARSVLNALLERNCPNVSVVDSCADLLTGVASIKEHQPDVVFLDIQMPNHYGYEIVNHFEEIDFEIIFVTAYDSYAIKAFEMSALDYIVKPIERTRLVSSIAKLSGKLSSQNKLDEYRVFIENIKSNKGQKIIIPELGNRRIVELKNINAIQAEGAYTHVHLLNEPKIVLGKNLKYFEGLLSDNDTFFRTHRSWLVNLGHVKSLKKTDLTITMKNDIIAKISKGKIDAFQLSF